ncbi:MAG: hypothetical protein WC310_05800 [Patescibacteria group bacterium]|jgi:hypothetical protein
MATFSTPIIVYVPNDPGVTPAERIAFMQAMGCAIDTEVPHKNTGTSETISRIWSFDQLPYLNSAASSNNHPVRKVEFDDLADLVNEVQLDSALDAEVVHLDGLELIEGEKVFVALPTLHVTSLTPTGRQLISATVCDAQIAAYNGGLKRKIISIGDWDMDASPFIIVAHGVADFKKIRNIQAIVRDDADMSYYPLNSIDNLTGTTPDGSVSFWGSINVNLMRVNSGSFDNTYFSSTSYNRGFVIIDYIT